MCAIFGFLNYGNKISHKILTKLLRELSIVAEVRGTDATGIGAVQEQAQDVRENHLLKKLPRENRRKS